MLLKERSILNYQAKMVGEKAYQLLARREGQGKVINVFSTAAYLEGEEGEIFWVAAADSPPHQRSLITSYSPEAFATGENFYHQSSRVQIGEKVFISMDQALIWKPLAIDFENIPNLSELERIWQNWLVAFQEINDPWIKIDRRFFPLVISSSKLKISTIVEKCARLIGLGPGFSPAGDDFVGGLLFVFYFLQKAYPELLEREENIISNFLEWARSRTNIVSWTILKDLALGQGPEPAHKILHNLFQGKDVSAIGPEVEELARLGHTTGRAIFYGILAGLLILLGRDYSKYLH